jgi:hypothetical protein
MQIQKGFALIVAAAVAGLGCSEGLTPPPEEPSVLTLPELIVSDAVAASAIIGAESLAVAGGADQTFVSLPPGTLPGVVSVRIRIMAGGTTTPAIPVIDGGFDPVPVAAVAGDELELTFTDVEGAVSVAHATVPDRRPPTVVRTHPPRGRPDVVFSISIRPMVVFSEPIDPETLAAGVRLLTGGTEVNASVALLPDELWIAELVPASELEPGTTYELQIATEIRDLDGDTLAEPVTVTFTTEGELRPGMALSGTYPRVSPWTYHGTSRFVLREDGRFTLEFRNVRDRATWSVGDVTYGGTYSATESGIRLDFEASPSWQATATLRGDSLIVRYNLAMHGASLPAYIDFEDGVYLQPGDGEPPPPGLTGRIAFVRDHDGSPHVHVANADGSGVVRITEGRSPSWSPDGRRIAFVRWETNDQGAVLSQSIYLMDADGSNETRLTEGRSPAWSPSGTRIAFVSSEGLSVMGVDGSGAEFLIRHDFRWGGDQGVDHPAWSPDESRIAFTLYADLDDIFSEQIYLMNADGSDPTPIYFRHGTAGDFAPAWSPNGAEIVLGSYGYGIVVMGLTEPTIPRSLYQGSSVSRRFDSQPVWYRDGRWILFDEAYWHPQELRWESDLYVLDRNGGFPRLLIPDARAPSWGPAP